MTEFQISLISSNGVWISFSSYSKLLFKVIMIPANIKNG